MVSMTVEMAPTSGFAVCIEMWYHRHELELNAKPVEVLEGKCHKGSDREGQKTSQQQGGHHGNPGTYQQSTEKPVCGLNTCQRILMGGGGGGGREREKGKKQASKQATNSAKQKHMALPLPPPTYM